MLCFLIFTDVLMGWYMGLYIHVGYCISKCFVFYKIIIYIFKLNSLVLCFFSYPAYVDIGELDCVQDSV